jgi:hypothetical protein
MKAGTLRKVGLAAALVCLLAASQAWGLALRRDVVVEIGEVSAAFRDVVRVPLFIAPVSSNNAVATLEFRLFYEHDHLFYLGYDLGEAALDAEKSVFVLEVQPGQLSIVVTGGLDAIEDGEFAGLYFEVLEGALSESAVPLSGAEASAADAEAAPLEVEVSGGAVLLGNCPLPASPQEVMASQGEFAGKVRVTWAAVQGAEAYRVYRAGMPFFSRTELIAEEKGVLYYDDYGVAVGGSDGDGAEEAFGCSKNLQLLKTGSYVQEHYYWVAAVNECGEGGPAGPALGHASKRRKTFPDSNVSASPGLFLAAAASLAALGRRRRRRS